MHKTKRAHTYALLRAIFASGASPKVKLVAENPCQIDGASQVSRAHEVKTASLEELATIVAHLPDRLQLAALLGDWCALRYGEIAELRRKDIDLGCQPSLTVAAR